MIEKNQLKKELFERQLSGNKRRIDNLKRETEGLGEDIKRHTERLEYCLREIAEAEIMVDILEQNYAKTIIAQTPNTETQ